MAALPRHGIQAHLAVAVIVVFGSRLQSEEIGQVALQRVVRALSDLDAVAAD